MARHIGLAPGFRHAWLCGRPTAKKLPRRGRDRQADPGSASRNWISPNHWFRQPDGSSAMWNPIPPRHAFRHAGGSSASRTPIPPEFSGPGFRQMEPGSAPPKNHSAALAHRRGARGAVFRVGAAASGLVPGSRRRIDCLGGSRAMSRRASRGSC